ncbi:UDP-glucose--hexose-1-phosphate uridylyltransferase [Melioribacteraceae bacterium 4301-Me]|uniref:UDP-glucose--hexose-1-phosphate uridylyltransferase n=1 Tax=Pyranulibacter aquaticus TaxID=3163344 RepID=UPI00359812D7
MQQLNYSLYTHRRKNILTGQWVLVSPQRTKRPWQGEISGTDLEERPQYDPNCYLCPNNKRANGDINPYYKDTFVFTNDFPALIQDVPNIKMNIKDLLVAKSEKGICRVVNFSPRHDLTLAEMSVNEIEKVIETWQDEFYSLSSCPKINYVTIFENKGSMMGNSNPHPHCQIWAQESIPMEPALELKNFKKYFQKNKRSLLSDYIKIEQKMNERIVYENEHFIILIPFWAVWPYETIVISKRKIPNILSFSDHEKKMFAVALKTITTKYDNLFQTSFPYSAGLHQAPTDGKKHQEWHFHMHFYPPLLRSATIKKFMVGYEMLAEPQRDLTPEFCADILRQLPEVHYKHKEK